MCKVGPFTVSIAIMQVLCIVLKLAQISKVATWTWLSVLSLTWLPLAVFVFISSVYMLFRMLPEKKNKLMYNSKGWQEKLAELNYNRWSH